MPGVDELRVFTMQKVRELLHETAEYFKLFRLRITEDSNEVRVPIGDEREYWRFHHAYLSWCSTSGSFFRIFRKKLNEVRSLARSLGLNVTITGCQEGINHYALCIIPQYTFEYYAYEIRESVIDVCGELCFTYVFSLAEDYDSFEP